jgi:hypothetical protein
MAEINYNNLYNQLSPMNQRYYDQQFSKNYVPGQENIMLSSQPAYEQMKAVYEAQQQVPEKSFLDMINPFSSASAAEMPPVPNLSLGYNMPTFDLGTGITNTTAATPVKIGIQDILSQYNIPGLRSQNLQEDLVQQIIEENKARTSEFMRPTMFDIAGDVPGGITQTKNLGIDTSYETALPQILASQSDFERNLLEPVVERKKSALEEMMSKGVIGGIGTFLSGILPQDPPEVRRVKDFYARNFGVNTAGSVASGIMQGYNPVSGGFLNYMTGGKYGEPMQVGLGRAMQRRIENILGRKAPQTDASRAKVEELRNLQLQEIRDRAAGGESLGSIGKSTFSGKGGAFEAKPSGAYSKGFAGGR